MKRAATIVLIGLLVIVATQTNALVTNSPSFLFAPFVLEDGVTTSDLKLYNPGNATANITIRYYNPDGTLATSETLALAAKAQVFHPTTPASAFFAGTSAAAEIEVTGGPNIVGAISRISPGSSVSERLTGSISTLLYDPAFVSIAPNFYSVLSLQNPTATTVQATADFRNPDGTLAASQSISLAPHASTRLLASTFVPAISSLAAVEVRVTSGSGLVGNVIRGTATQAESSVMTDHLATSLYTPLIQEGWSTNNIIALQNPNSVTSSGTLEYRNLDGTLAVSVPFTLPAHGLQRFFAANYVSASWTSLPLASVKVTVSSGPGIVGIATHYNPDYALGLPMNVNLQTDLVGLAMIDAGFWGTRLALQNPSSVGTTQAQITFYNMDGSVASTQTAAIAPGTTFSLLSVNQKINWSGVAATVAVKVISGPGLVGATYRVANSSAIAMAELVSPLPAPNLPPALIDTDLDSVLDGVDDSPDTPGRPEWNGSPSAIYVKAKKHKVKATTTFPEIEDQILAGLNVYLFALDEGSIAEDDDEEDEDTGTVLNHALKHKNYRYIVDNVTPVAVKQINEDGTVLFGVNPGKYLLIGEEADGTLVGKKVGHVREGKLKKKKLKMLLVNGKKHPAKSRRRHGSDLWVIQPAEVEWTNPTEYYPFVFETTKSWEITVELLPPAGFVSDANQLSANVTDTQRCIQFEVIDIGSAWVPTDVVITLVHNAATEIIEEQIDVVNSILP